jgi:hypothetical protein
MEPKPRAVIVIAIFLYIATVIALVVGASLLFPNSALDRLWELNRPAEPAFQAMGRFSGVLLLCLGMLTFIAAVGLLRRKPWAWWAAVALFAVNGAGDAVSFVFTRDWLKSASGVVVASGFLGALLSRRVRRYFNRRA